MKPGMSDEALSQNQVESLLKAMEKEGGAGVPTPEGAPPPPGQASADGGPPPPQFSEESSPTLAGQEPSARPRRPPAASSVPMGGPRTHFGSPVLDVRTTAYDFKRPERVSKEQMRAIKTLHESLARNFGASMSGMLRTMTEVKLVSVDQLTYSEFVFSLDNPSCFNVLGVAPLDGHWVLDIAPELAYALIDRMLGGDPKPSEAVKRPLTEIENRLMGRCIDSFLSQLHEAWENIVKLDLSLEKMESNPQLVQIVPPNEVVILIGFEVLLGENRGMFNLCIPYTTIESHAQNVSRGGWGGYGRAESSDATRSTVRRGIHDAPMDVVVTLARSRVRTGDLLDLAIGDIITTEVPSTEPLEMSIQDVTKFHARPGAYRGKKAVSIDDVIRPG